MSKISKLGSIFKKDYVESTKEPNAMPKTTHPFQVPII